VFRREGIVLAIENCHLSWTGGAGAGHRPEFAQ